MPGTQQELYKGLFSLLSTPTPPSGTVLCAAMQAVLGCVLPLTTQICTSTGHQSHLRQISLGQDRIIISRVTSPNPLP